MARTWDLPGMYLSTKEPQDTQTRGGGGGRGVDVAQSWDLAGMYLGTI